jgi:hypothetical protein
VNGKGGGGRARKKGRTGKDDRITNDGGGGRKTSGGGGTFGVDDDPSRGAGCGGDDDRVRAVDAAVPNATPTEEGAAGGMTAPAVPWKDVWAAMKRNGWTWKGGSGLMTDYYIKPRCKVQGGKAGRDCFVRVEDAMGID